MIYKLYNCSYLISFARVNVLIIFNPYPCPLFPLYNYYLSPNHFKQNKNPTTNKQTNKKAKTHHHLHHHHPQKTHKKTTTAKNQNKQKQKTLKKTNNTTTTTQQTNKTPKTTTNKTVIIFSTFSWRKGYSGALLDILFL